MIRIRPRTVRRLTLVSAVCVLLVAVAISALFVRRWQKSRALDSLRNDAMALYEAGNAESALPMLARYQRNRPDDPDVLLALSRARRDVELGDGSHTDKAVRQFELYRRLAPSDLQASFELLELYRDLRRAPEAVTLADQLLASGELGDARRAEVLMISAAALSETDPLSTEADARVREAVGIDPSSFEGQWELARVIRRTDPDSACERASLLLDSGDPRMDVIALVACDERWIAGLGPGQDTLESLFRVTEDAPDAAFADEEFAEVLLGLAAEARRTDIESLALRRAADAETGDSDWAIRYVRRLYQTGQYSDVVAEAGRLAGRSGANGIDLGAYELITRWTLDATEPAELISAAEDLEGRDGRFRTRAWASAFRALYALRSGDLTGADTRLAEAVEDYTAEPLLHALHGDVLVRLHRYESARASWETASAIAGASWPDLELKTVRSLIREGRVRAAFDRAFEATARGGSRIEPYVAWFEAFTELLRRGRTTPDERAVASSTLRAFDSAFDKIEDITARAEIERSFIEARVGLAAMAGDDVAGMLDSPVSRATLESSVVLRRVASLLVDLGYPLPSGLEHKMRSAARTDPDFSLMLALRAHDRGDPGAASMLRTPEGEPDGAWALARAMFSDRTAETPDERRAAAGAWSRVFESDPGDVDTIRLILESETAPLDAGLISRSTEALLSLTGAVGEAPPASVVLARAEAVRVGDPTGDEHAAAVGSLEQTVARTPTNIRARLVLSSLYWMHAPEKGITADPTRAADQLMAASELIGGMSADFLRLRSAQFFRVAGDYNAARDALFRMLDREEHASPDMLMIAGDLLLTQGEPRPAINLLVRAEAGVAEERRSAVLCKLGRAHEASADDETASGYFRDAVEAGLREPEDVLAAASHFARTGDETWRARAIASLETLDLEPGLAELTRARHADQMREYQQADDLYRSALELRPSWAEAWADLGRLRLRAGDVDGASSAIETGLQHRPDDVDLRILEGQLRLRASAVGGRVDFAALARVYQQQDGGERLAEATRTIAEYQSDGRIDDRASLIALAGEYSEILNVQRFVGRRLIADDIAAYPEAAELMMRAVERFPADAETARFATLAYQALGDNESMQSAALIWRRRDPLAAKESDFYVARGSAELGQTDRAADIVDRYIPDAFADPDDQLHLNYLWLWLQLEAERGGLAEAEARLGDLLSESELVLTLVWLGGVAEVIPDWETASRWLDRAEPFAVNDRLTTNLLAACRRRIDNGFSDHEAAIARADGYAASLGDTSADPAITDALAELSRVRADTLRASGRDAEAERIARSAIDGFLAAASTSEPGSPDWVHGHTRAGAVAASIPDLDRAIELHRLILEQEHVRGRVRATTGNELAYLLTLRDGPGDMQRAESEINRALEWMTHPAMLHTRGKIEEQSGRPDAAAASYREALAIDPDHLASLASLSLLLARGDELDRAEARQYYERLTGLDVSGVSGVIRNDFASAGVLLDGD